MAIDDVFTFGIRFFVEGTSAYAGSNFMGYVHTRILNDDNLLYTKCNQQKKLAVKFL